MLDRSEIWKDRRPDQVIVNKYLGKQGISPHIDQVQLWSGQIVTISLGQECRMHFRKVDSPKQDCVSVLLKSGSILSLTKDARYNYFHSIPATRQYLDADDTCQGKNLSQILGHFSMFAAKCLYQVIWILVKFVCTIRPIGLYL